MEKWITKTVKMIQLSDDLVTIKEILVNIKHKLNFEHVSYTVKAPSTFTKISNFIISDCPHKWVYRYIDMGYVKVDPVMKHCTESALPYCWDRLTETENGNDDEITKYVDDAAQHGFIGGISIGINDKNGFTGIFSLSTNHEIKTDSGECCNAALHVSALLPYVHEAIIRLSSKMLKPLNDIKLTPRELDCLLWTAEGKTSDEIAQILSIKSVTVVFHLKNVIKKLNVSNRNQAIAKAVLFGLISPQYSSLAIPPTYHF